MKTNREKDVIKKYNEFKKEKTISLEQLEEYNKAVWKLILEMERLRKRYDKIHTHSRLHASIAKSCVNEKATS